MGGGDESDQGGSDEGEGLPDEGHDPTTNGRRFAANDR